MLNISPKELMSDLSKIGDIVTRLKQTNSFTHDNLIIEVVKAINEELNPKTTNMKTITQNDVIAVAADLIIANGNTTTLEVKNELRNKGFRAFQVEVSQLMDAARHSENWDVDDNGVYRVYSENAIITKPAKQASPQSNISKTGVAIGDWEVDSVTDSRIQYFPAHFSRDEVRSAYVKHIGVLFVDTRSRRVK